MTTTTTDTSMTPLPPTGWGAKYDDFAVEYHGPHGALVTLVRFTGDQHRTADLGYWECGCGEANQPVRPDESWPRGLESQPLPLYDEARTQALDHVGTCSAPRRRRPRPRR